MFLIFTYALIEVALTEIRRKIPRGKLVFTFGDIIGLKPPHMSNKVYNREVPLDATIVLTTELGLNIVGNGSFI